MFYYKKNYVLFENVLLQYASNWFGYKIRKKKPQIILYKARSGFGTAVLKYYTNTMWSNFHQKTLSNIPENHIIYSKLNILISINPHTYITRKWIKLIGIFHFFFFNSNFRMHDRYLEYSFIGCIILYSKIFLLDRKKVHLFIIKKNKGNRSNVIILIG